MFLPRVWLLLQTLSLLTSSFAFASTRPMTAVTSDPSSTASRRHPVVQYRNNKQTLMCRAFDPQQPQNCHHGPLLAFHSREQRGKYSASSSYQHSQDRHQRTQPRYSNGVLPLAMIPGSRHPESNNTSSSFTCTSFLNAVKRGGGDDKALSAPTTTTSTASDGDSLSPHKYPQC